MDSVTLLFPHQLDDTHPVLNQENPIYLIEELLFFREFHFHKMKLAYHRATMKAFADRLIEQGLQVNYIDTRQEVSDIRKLIPQLAKEGIQKIDFIEPNDDWLSKRIKKACRLAGMNTEVHPSSLFILSKAELDEAFPADKKSYHLHDFYKKQRQKRNILLEDGGPKGGKWSLDAENRKKYPSGKTPPAIRFPESTGYWKEAIDFIEQEFPNNPGSLKSSPLYPINPEQSKAWLRDFLEYRFYGFGDYEDAIVAKEAFLHHSVLTPMLNIGLLKPQQVLDAALEYAEEHNIPLNTTEGFVRQILGWREFMRGMYEKKGVKMRNGNFWKHHRKMPAAFYTGNTGIPPIDQTIRKVLKTGYCHHIERLMLLGNFMLLCEIDPEEVYTWFMELFIDAYDWVMVPNVYGMSQFADGGIFATKPYISSSNYVLKMSDYKKGNDSPDWTEIWDALFWEFMHKHRDNMARNPRIAMLLKNYDKMPEEKKRKMREVKEGYLARF